MVTIFASPKLLMMALPLTSHPMNKPTIFWGGTNKSLDGNKNKPNLSAASGLQMKRHILSRLNDSRTNIVEISSTECQKNEQEIVTSPPLEIIKRLLISNMVLTKISAVSAATLKSWKFDMGKARQLDDRIAEPANYERLLEDGQVFQQNFTIRSFEIRSDFKISMEALMNYLQEASLNHLKSVGILADGFGSTPEMIVRDLIWVVCWSHIEVDHYPSWADVVQVNAWIYRSGKNGIRRDWHIRDLKTGRTLIRATSLYAMINKKTRKFAKLSEEVISDLKPFLRHCDPIIQKDSIKPRHLDTDKADYVRTGLTPGWTDMDVNQHVSHIKLVNYVLESVPRSVVESHELSAMTLEYRKECNGDSVLQSLSKVITNPSDHLIDNQEIEFDHLLGLVCGPEIVRARTRWKPNYAN